MSNLFERLRIYVIYLIFRVRPYTRKKARQIASQAASGARVLEIGSGKPNPQGRHYFSFEDLFTSRCATFTKSDLRGFPGMKAIDLVKFSEVEAYDHILCFHVLDDIYEWEVAIRNLYRALAPNGVFHLILPGLIPLNTPHDLFRFSEDLLMETCRRNGMTVDHFETHGFRTFPFAYYLRVKKTTA